MGELGIVGSAAAGLPRAVAAEDRFPMVRDQMLEILRCPQDRSTLAPADDELVARLNVAIRAGRLRSQSGRQVDRAIDGGLVRAAGDLVYPIVDQIPVMLSDEAILLNQLDEH